MCSFFFYTVNAINSTMYSKYWIGNRKLPIAIFQINSTSLIVSTFKAR